MDHTPRSAQLIQLVRPLPIDTAAGRAGLQSVMREIETLEPGALKRMTDALQRHRQSRESEIHGPPQS